MIKMLMKTATTFSKSKIFLIATLTVAIVVSASITGFAKPAYSQNGSSAPDFNLKTVAGKQVSLESFKGRPLVLWFMAAWCPSCVGQAGAIKQVSSEYGTKVNVLVIDLWAFQNIGQSVQGLNAETVNDLKAFIAKNGSPQWNA